MKREQHVRIGGIGWTDRPCRVACGDTEAQADVMTEREYLDTCTSLIVSPLYVVLRSVQTHGRISTDRRMP